MVIKLYSINDKHCVKISDELTKVRPFPCPPFVPSILLLNPHASTQNTGDPEAVKLVKRRFGLEEDGGESKWGPTI
jgi:hypothetical protein